MEKRGKLFSSILSVSRPKEGYRYVMGTMTEVRADFLCASDIYYVFSATPSAILYFSRQKIHF